MMMMMMMIFLICDTRYIVVRSMFGSLCIVFELMCFFLIHLPGNKGIMLTEQTGLIPS